MKIKCMLPEILCIKLMNHEYPMGRKIFVFPVIAASMYAPVSGNVKG
ncbi:MULTISPECIES: hypothetical protein [Parabacteroides]|nr:hypothetical protein [Parabacteroides provencensis]